LTDRRLPLPGRVTLGLMPLERGPRPRLAYLASDRRCSLGLKIPPPGTTLAYDNVETLPSGLAGGLSALRDAHGVMAQRMRGYGDCIRDLGVPVARRARAA